MTGTGVEAGRLRVVPEGVTHGPSRELLAAGELCWSYAYLDLEASGDEPLQSANSWYERQGVRGTEGLYVLGEARYGAFEGPVTVLLDGASGEVFLARPDDDDVLQRDLLASSPQCLIALAAEIEAVSAAATGEHGLAEGEVRPYGPAAVTEVQQLVRQLLREADPELFRRTDDRPAHWETALTVRALGWGARAGGPGELAYAVPAALVEDLATLKGEGGVRRFEEAELPAAISHGPTRRLLREVGLPVSGRCVLRVDAEGALRTLAEEYPENFEGGEEGEDEDELSTRPQQGGFLVVGGWMYGFVVVLDGATGRVELPDSWDDGEPAAYLHRDLSALLYVLWTFERLRAVRRGTERPRRHGPWSVFTPSELLDGAAEAVMRALDPEAFESESHFWPIRIDDGHMGSLLE
ncbi:SUKH-4 family immunity protein [Kitasatospora sp. NPDC059648]|uniref:SUKH-4 family immunity protein n=1 Tax=Kitasatospora sp. NPDC059648 TaxID=3346894 RepID=UPI0036BBA3E2